MEAKKQTKFGRLVSGTEYSSYAIDNNFRLDNKNFIEKKINNEFRDNVKKIYWEDIADKDTELYRKYFK